MAESYDQVALCLDDVCRQSAAKARLTNRPELSIQKDDHDMIRTFIDHGIMKIATRAGVIRGEYGENSPTDNADPADVTDPLVPSELLRALSFYVLSEWYKLIDENLGTFYMNEYKQELADHRFHPGTSSKTTRPYNPL